jgi:hypothetical protein
MDVFSNPCTTTPSPLAPGSTATIGFWHNKNGQAVIDLFNGGPAATSLGNYLVTTYPNLYGCLKGQTNAQIAQLFLNDFGVSGMKPDAQVLAVALATYTTSSTLSGSTLAAQYGFKITPAGIGGAQFNVGSDGAAVGVPNGTVLSINQILQGAAAQSTGCVLDAKNLSLLRKPTTCSV